jgi:hypothetical protein
MRRVCTGLLAAALGAALSVAPAAAQTTRPSPFADKGCVSYASVRDAKGKLVEIPWSELKPDDFGPATVRFDYTGVRSLRPAPPPGVHPRVFFGPDDLPEIRARLTATQCGRAAWRNILAWTEGMKGRYDDRAAYAQPDVWKGSFGGLRGPVPLFRLGKGGWKTDRYRRLVAGDTTDEAGFFWSVYPLEAFRCLIEDDRPAARDLAAAVVTSLKIDQAKRDEERRKKNETGSPDQPVGGHNLALTYDLLYNDLTPEQRRLIHEELADGTWRHDNYGTFNDATAGRSNWATFSYWLIQLVSIEGESGFNDLKYAGLYRGWRNLLTYGWFASGATFEGEAKNQLGMDGVIVFARRGTRENLAGHPHLRAYATKFLPHSVMPQGDAFLKYDLLGGAKPGSGINPIDALGLKFMFPDDKAIDWVYRNHVGADYARVPDRPDGYFNALLFYAIFATDFDPANDEPGKLDLGNTFFCGERSLMLTRSGWGRDALLLGMHTRGATGGHPYADRNAIMLAGAGRVWSAPYAYNADENRHNSVVVIDDKPQSVNTPARVVDFVDAADATFMVGDAKYAWDWRWVRIDRRDKSDPTPFTLDLVRGGKVTLPERGEPELNSFADFAYTKRDGAWLRRPMFELPHWLAKEGFITPVARVPNFPVRRAFRTAGVVRGERPFAVVVDDIQKDDAPHQYDWVLMLELDVQVASITRADASSGAAFDIVLTGDESTPIPEPKKPLPGERGERPIPAGQPMLLVRVLNRSEPEPVAGRADARVESVSNEKNQTVRRLVIPARAVSPDFKVLLYPFRQGEPLPTTAWSADRSEVKVTAGGAAWAVKFTPAASGKTDVRVSRVDGGKARAVADVAAPVAPMARP